MVKAVIFDFDGVVVDSEPLIFEAAKKVFAEYGADLTLEDVRPGIGAGISYVSVPMKKYGIEGVTLEQMVDRRSEEFLQIAETRLRKNDGFDDLVRFVRAKGWKTALASSSHNDWIEKSMAFAGVDRADFDVVVNGDSIQRKKPFPDLFLNAAVGLGFPPSECIVIEDALPGIEAARRAGSRVIGLVGTMSEEDLQVADFVTTSLGEVGKILNTI